MNKKIPRIHREVLSADLARSLLNVPHGEGTGSLWQHLERSRQELAATVDQANKELAVNPLAEILAEHAMRQVGKRGYPQVVVDSDGSVMLVINYDAPPKAPEEPVGRKSSLPSITVLRVEAENLGIDHTPFGKNKTRLLKAIEAAKTAKVPVPLPRTPSVPVEAPKVKQPPAAVVPALPPKAPPAPVVPPTPPPQAPPPQAPPPRIPAIQVDEDDDGVGHLFQESPTPPAPSAPPVVVPRRGTPAPAAPVAASSQAPATPPRKPGGRSLSDLVGRADAEVDIDAILSKGAPPPPKS